MRLAREGMPFLLMFAATALLLWAVGTQAPWPGRTWRVVLLSLASLFTVLTLFTGWFFRDPDRTPPADPTAVVSPADGKVLSVDEVDEPTFMGGAARRITVFLNVFNVHVQRSPASGTVEHYEYRPGEYLVAWEPKASERNEQASIGIRTEFGPVLSRQIAGLVARRIVTYPREGDGIGRGDRYGLIRFGSRVDLFVPLHWNVVAAPGDVVKAGETVVAHQALLETDQTTGEDFAAPSEQASGAPDSPEREQAT
jgi:phosphatidylserine decarboxylase